MTERFGAFPRGGDGRGPVMRTPDEVAAMLRPLIQTAKLNGREPLAYLADVLQRSGVRADQDAQAAYAAALGVDAGGQG